MIPIRTASHPHAVSRVRLASRIGFPTALSPRRNQRASSNSMTINSLTIPVSARQRPAFDRVRPRCTGAARRLGRTSCGHPEQPPVLEPPLRWTTAAHKIHAVPVRHHHGELIAPAVRTSLQTAQPTARPLRTHLTTSVPTNANRSAMLMIRMGPTANQSRSESPQPPQALPQGSSSESRPRLTD